MQSSTVIGWIKEENHRNCVGSDSTVILFRHTTLLQQISATP